MKYIIWILISHILCINTKRHKLNPNDCYVLQAGSWGLGSNLVHLILAMNYVGLNKIYWDFSRNPYGCCNKNVKTSCINNGWNTIFQSNIALNLPQKRKYKENSGIAYHSMGSFTFTNSSSNRSITCYGKSFNDLTPPTKFRNGSYDDTRCNNLCSTLNSFWQPSYEIQILIDHELMILSQYPKPIIAIHLRGGDKIKDAEAKPYKLNPTIDTLSYLMSKSRWSNQNGTCVILGDDSKLGDKAMSYLKKKMSCHIYNRVRPDHSHNQADFNNMASELRCLETKQLLIDIEILSSADAAIGLADSNVVRLAANLRRCRKTKNIFLDWHGRDIFQNACSPYINNFHSSVSKGKKESNKHMESMNKSSKFKKNSKGDISANTDTTYDDSKRIDEIIEGLF